MCCDSAWLGDHEDAAVNRISQLSSALSNLTLETVELLQVCTNHALLITLTRTACIYRSGVRLSVCLSGKWMKI